MANIDEQRLAIILGLGPMPDYFLKMSKRLNLANYLHLNINVYQYLLIVENSFVLQLYKCCGLFFLAVNLLPRFIIQFRDDYLYLNC